MFKVSSFKKLYYNIIRTRSMAAVVQLLLKANRTILVKENKVVAANNYNSHDCIKLLKTKNLKSVNYQIHFYNYLDINNILFGIGRLKL